MELIPGLTNDLARECLIRVPFQSFASLLSVCKAWNREIRNPHFHRYRKLAGLTRPVFVIHQEVASTSRFQRILLFDPVPRVWTRLPPFPSSNSESVNSVVGIGSNKILKISSGLGYGHSNTVHVFDFFTGQWRRAKDMPGPGLHSFGLACDPTRGKVLVAGGREGGTLPTRSALMYDVAKDKWVRLGDMGKARYACNAVFHGGKFHVIGGYNSDYFLSKFLTCGESLDPDTWQWGPVEEENLLESNRLFGHCKVMENGEGDLYCVGRNVGVRRGGGKEWHVATGIPEELLFAEGVATCKDKMVVRTVMLHDTKVSYLLLDLKGFEWTMIDLPEEYSIRSLEKGCGIEL